MKIISINCLTEEMILKDIEDNLSSNKHMQNIISCEIKSKTLRAVKNIIDNFYEKKICRIKNLIKVINEIIEDILSDKEIMNNLIELKRYDEYTSHHSINVTILSLCIGIRLNLPIRELKKLCIGALLHDIGKVFINKSIINKADKLTNEEYEEIKKHPKLGYLYAKKYFSRLTLKSLNAILQHQEKYDGTGYPNRLKGKQISLFGRIIAIADVYDALISDRPYRKALSHDEVLDYIKTNSGTHFDPALVNIFI